MSLSLFLGEDMEGKILANNRKAYHDFFVEATYEAGIVLEGSEVKSIRLGNANLRDSFCIIKNGRLSLIGMHVSPYKMGSYYNPDPKRTRELLMRKDEIRKLAAKVNEKGYTLVATKLYLKLALVKVELALCKGKEGKDKRQSIKERDMKREAERAIKESY